MFLTANMKSNKPVSNFAMDPALERYRLAKQFIPQNTKTVLDVGGVSFVRKNKQWRHDLGPAKQWGGNFL
jgi:hypothetical protein